MFRRIVVIPSVAVVPQKAEAVPLSSAARKSRGRKSALQHASAQLASKT
jgi:hypothetical protein